MAVTRFIKADTQTQVNSSLIGVQIQLPPAPIEGVVIDYVYTVEEYASTYDDCALLQVDNSVYIRYSKGDGVDNKGNNIYAWYKYASTNQTNYDSYPGVIYTYNVVPNIDTTTIDTSGNEWTYTADNEMVLTAYKRCSRIFSYDGFVKLTSSNPAGTSGLCYRDDNEITGYRVLYAPQLGFTFKVVCDPMTPALWVGLYVDQSQQTETVTDLELPKNRVLQTGAVEWIAEGAGPYNENIVGITSYLIGENVKVGDELVIEANIPSNFTIKALVYDEQDPVDCTVSYSVTGKEDSWTDWSENLTDLNNVIANIPRYMYLKFSQDVEITEE